MERKGGNLEKRSSWASPDKFSDTRTQRRFNRLLKVLNDIAEYLLILFVIVFFIENAWFIYTNKFEELVFHDGSYHMCIFDGNGKPIPVDK